MRTNLLKTSIVLLGALLGPAMALAHDARIGSLHVMHPASRATLPGQNSGVVYLTIENEGSLVHNLRTIVLDPKGRLFQQFDGNQWTPAELAEAIAKAAAR